MSKRSFIVGVTGGSGSGKTYFLKKLVEKLGADQVCLISQDNYYRDRSLQPKDENGIENFDTPESIDHAQFIADIKKIRQGETVTRKEYTYNNATKEAKELVFKPLPIVIVEGIFVLHFHEVSRLIDLKLFIDAKEPVKILRRITRDQKERGYDLDDVLYRYEKHVLPAYEMYIEKHKFDADLIVSNNKSFDMALTVIQTFLNTLIHQSKAEGISVAK